MSTIERITISPDVCGGRPSIRGLRIRVKDVLELLVGIIRKNRGSGLLLPHVVSFFRPTNQEVARSSRAGRTIRLAFVSPPGEPTVRENALSERSESKGFRLPVSIWPSTMTSSSHVVHLHTALC